MFRKHPKEIQDLVQAFLRANGLETPLLQRRLIEAWDDVAGSVVARYTEDKQIRNQTLFVRINNPAIKSDLQMRRTALVTQLNNKVGAMIITDIRLI